MEKRLKDRPDDLERWKTTHRPNCHKNHTGSSGSMEVAAAAVMWGRSEQYGLRYTTMISDGDSKTYNELTKNPPYDGIAVTKGECVNHVSKRIGTQLRNVVADERKRGVALGGRASLALTQEKIAKLQVYFTRAVRSVAGSRVAGEDICFTGASEEDIKVMADAIKASYFHCVSTDAFPRHMLCPEGPDSWCFFNRAQARDEPVPEHKKHQTCFFKGRYTKE
ncbi:uncharacterized protein LOC101850529 [Aplysia californica]|uniref:Uncharacterized protein LOC101850529 n=1 Tax=Aplysia californica TaxID=6500 RepID=A0ABM0JD29_APLCA|nr:uncharacterized protein LOC101850529 [Aplysia californica]